MVMLCDKSFSAYIIPIRSDGRVAHLKYGEKAYGLIGGRVAPGEKLADALRRELGQELGPHAVQLADMAWAVPVPYSFRHTSRARAEQRGALAEEHHIFIAHVPDDMDLNFCETRPGENISIEWATPDEFVQMYPVSRDFFETHIIPNLKCRFSMNLQDKYYRMIANGDKDIELRLYDEKRRLMRNGDFVLVYNAQKPSEYIIAKIVRMHLASSFANLYKKISPQRCGFSGVGAALRALTEFYSDAAQEKYGVVGLELEINE